MRRAGGGLNSDKACQSFLKTGPMRAMVCMLVWCAARAQEWGIMFQDEGTLQYYSSNLNFTNRTNASVMVWGFVLNGTSALNEPHAPWSTSALTEPQSALNEPNASWSTSALTEPQSALNEPQSTLNEPNASWSTSTLNEPNASWSTSALNEPNASWSTSALTEPNASWSTSAWPEPTPSNVSGGTCWLSWECSGGVGPHCMCIPGYYHGDYGCEACWPGTFKAGYGFEACAGCREDTYTSVWGSTSCEACAAGHYTDERGATACRDCPFVWIPHAVNMTGCWADSCEDGYVL